MTSCVTSSLATISKKNAVKRHNPATIAALTTGQSCLDALPGTVKMRRRQLGGLIAAQLPGVPGQPPQPAYLGGSTFGRVKGSYDLALSPARRAPPGGAPG